MADRTGLLEAIERKTSALFFLAGGVMIIFAMNTYLKTYAGTSYPIIQNVIAPSGFLVSVIGLLGLYPALADRTPRLARIAAGIALITTVGWVAIVMHGIGMIIGVLSELSGPLAILPLVVIVLMVGGFGLYGATILYTGGHSWIVGTLLLLESAMFLVLLLRLAPSFLLIDIGHVLAFLGSGGTLWATDRSQFSGEPAPDSPV